MNYERAAGRLFAVALALAAALSVYSACLPWRQGEEIRQSGLDGGTIAAPASGDPEPAASSLSVPAAVTLEAAKEIALRHAGADSGSAVFTKAKLDKAVYELKFSDETGKYEYEISAIDGAILDCSWDLHASAGQPETQFLLEGGREQAEQAALDAAGVSRETLKYLTCYLSWSDHIPVAYEVKFATRWASYRYTIGLDSGEILEGGCLPHA